MISVCTAVVNLEQYTRKYEFHGIDEEKDEDTEEYIDKLRKVVRVNTNSDIDIFWMNSGRSPRPKVQLPSGQAKHLLYEKSI